MNTATEQFAGHTAGPWVTTPLGDFGKVNVKTENRTVGFFGTQFDRKEDEQNAVLCAAAPQLLAERDALLAALKILISDVLIEPCQSCQSSGIQNGTNADACHRCGGCGKICTEPWPDDVENARKLLEGVRALEWQNKCNS